MWPESIRVGTYMRIQGGDIFLIISAFIHAASQTYHDHARSWNVCSLQLFPLVKNQFIRLFGELVVLFGDGLRSYQIGANRGTQNTRPGRLKKKVVI